MKLTNRIWRALIRRSLPIIFRPACRGEELTRLGSRYGGWTVPLYRLHPGSVCYSFGVGEDLTFDLALAAAAGCQIHLFDPTPRSRRHFDMLKEAAHGKNKCWAKMDGVYQAHSLGAMSSLIFHGIGVWSEDKVLDFYEPADPSHVSHSITNVQHTRVGFRATVKSVYSIAEMLEHEHIDFLKMDIEGAEIAVIDALLSEGPLPLCLCVEFDAAAQGDLREIKTLFTVSHRLRMAGYRLSHIEDWNFLFVMDQATESLNQ